jgi:hypothetical protein
MPRITITQEAHNAIRAASTAPGGFNSSGTRLLKRGRVSIEIGLETVQRLEGARMKPETISDTIIRILALQAGKPN